MDWTRGIEIEPSLYAADFARLGEQVSALLAAGARVLHFDTGDGHFVEPITIGPVVLRSIAPFAHAAGAVLDCHLMVDDPVRHIEQFAKAGGDSVTVHVEADGAREAMTRARALGLGVGLAFNPETSVPAVAAAAGGADLVLCMSIHPGYSGQAFMPEALDRIRELRRLLPAGVAIQVDGGIDLETAPAAREAGATLLVAGSAVFGRPDPAAAFRELAAAAA